MPDESPPKRRADLEPLAQVEEGYVLLPFSEDQFRDFIKTLLGSPQAFSRRFFGEFEVDASTLRNVHYLLLQRLQQQNDSTLIYFRARIDYSDDSSVEHDSIESLLSYNEIRPVVSVGAHLTWDFLVRFTDRPVPEKQRVQLSVDTGNAFFATRTHEHDDSEEVRQSRIEFRVEHTARTWAADIESMLSSHLNTIVHPPSKWMILLRKHGVKAIVTITAIFAMVALVVTGRGVTARAQKNIDEITASIRASEDAATKIEYLGNLIAHRSWSGTQSTAMVPVIIMAGFMLVGTLCSTIFLAVQGRGEPGFLLLTKESLRHKADVQRRLKRRWFAVMGTIIFAIAIELIANIIFALSFADKL